jgi:uracil-DNA glycosylase family 4
VPIRPALWPPDRLPVVAEHPADDSLSAIADDVSRCAACPRLVEWREQIADEKRASYRSWEYWGRGVPPFGDDDADVVIVGLAPAAHGANRTGRMFTGDRSGDWLYRALHRAGFANQPTSTDVDDGLTLSRVLITSPVKCAPPANKPTTVERDTCRPFLERELAVVDPAVFVALGGFAYQVLARHLGISPRPKFGHGVEAVDADGRVVICSYHVSQQNTFTGRLTEAMLDGVFARANQLASERPAR